MERRIDVHAPTGLLARAALQSQLDKLRSLEVAVRGAGAEAAVHDMRVATRRLRAALHLFREHLPARRSKRLRQELRWLAANLGRVRDLDVLSATLREWYDELAPAQRGGWDRLVAEFTAARARALQPLCRALDSRRYSRLIDGLLDLIDRPLRARDRAERVRVARTAPACLEQQYLRMSALALRVRAHSDPAEELHALRIRAKRLRYALEFHEATLGAGAATLVPSLVELQDLLGSHQDAVVAQARLRALVPAADPSGAALRDAVAAAIERYVRQATRARRSLPARLRAVRPAAWRRARRTWSLPD
jgi:CHAD domain-containing protein